MQTEIKKFLENNNFLPISEPNWNIYRLHHKKPANESEEKRIFSEIKKSLGGNNGLYIYEKSGKVLYVGKGHPLFSRVKSHYQESYKEVKGDTRFATWHKFFSKYAGEMKIYWKELENEEIRKIVEQMLDYILKPEFDKFRKEHERSRRSKEKRRTD